MQSWHSFMTAINHSYRSPNFNSRPESAVIDTIIIHYTEMENYQAAINRLCDPETKVSSHYLISKDGEIFSLVDENCRAWHAGQSFWDGRDNINNYSIGIELDNNGSEEFTDQLMHALIFLCNQIKNRHPIKPSYILGHSDIAPYRKKDPGRMFNWKLLAENNIGLYFLPHTSSIILENLSIEELQIKLMQFGYDIKISGILDDHTSQIIKIFSDHYFQNNHKNEITSELIEILDQLLLAKLHI